MNAIVEEVLTKIAEFGSTLVIGYVGAAFKLGKRVTAAELKVHTQFKARAEAMDARVDGIEQRLAEKFTELRASLGQGLHLELATIRQYVDGEVQHLRERVKDLKDMAEDLRQKSGDYSEEAELAAFMGKVGEWMARTNQAVGRLEGMLGATAKAITTRPPPPVVNPRPKLPPPRPR